VAVDTDKIEEAVLALLHLALHDAATALSRLHIKSRGIEQSHFRQQTSEAPSHA
jgi:hypothetical protein